MFSIGNEQVQLFFYISHFPSVFKSSPLHLALKQSYMRRKKDNISKCKGLVMTLIMLMPSSSVDSARSYNIHVFKHVKCATQRVRMMWGFSSKKRKLFNSFLWLISCILLFVLVCGGRGGHFYRARTNVTVLLYIKTV